MKKKLLTLLLTACLLLAILTGLGVGAAALDYGMDAFAPIRVYDGRFTDVRAADWYYGSVASLYELGLAEGQSLTAFGSRSSVSLAEVAAFAARIHSVYYFGSPSAGLSAFAVDGGSWYDSYVAYLKNFGIIDGGFGGSWNRAATRAQAAYILARTLPEYELGEINHDAVTAGYSSVRYILDVHADTPYADEILTLYVAGVVTGSDSIGSFLPYTEITRAELAAILTRIVCPEKRVLLDWDVPDDPDPVYPDPEPVYPDPDPVDPDPDPVDPEPDPVDPEPEPAVPAAGTYPALVFEQGRYISSHSADDEQSVLSNIRWLFRNGETELKLKLEPGAMRPDTLNRLLENYLNASQLYLEQGYTSVGCRYDYQGNVTLSFSNPNGGDRDAALTRALVLYDRFHADGTITPGMSEVQTARVYAEYLCKTCQYDYSSARVSHTAYGALIKGSAVCEGYTAAYNILLKLEGINASTAQSPNHIWTTATLDGILYHIDVTWCDQDYGFEPRYFCMTPEFSLGRQL